MSLKIKLKYVVKARLIISQLCLWAIRSYLCCSTTAGATGFFFVGMIWGIWNFTDESVWFSLISNPNYGLIEIGKIGKYVLPKLHE